MSGREDFPFSREKAVWMPSVGRNKNWKPQLSQCMGPRASTVAQLKPAQGWLPEQLSSASSEERTLSLKGHLHPEPTEAPMFCSQGLWRCMRGQTTGIDSRLMDGSMESRKAWLFPLSEMLSGDRMIKGTTSVPREPAIFPPALPGRSYLKTSLALELRLSGAGCSWSGWRDGSEAELFLP